MTGYIPVRLRGRFAMVECRNIARDDWPVLHALMGPKGVGGGCWCQWPIVPHGGKLWRACQGKRNRRAFRKEIEAGAVHGSLAFDGDSCVGWCRYGPWKAFARLHNSPSLNTDPPEGTWSIVCFYIPANQRGRGIGSALLRHALATMKREGVTLVEAYPVPDRSLEGQPVPPAFAWTGVTGMFEPLGFAEHVRTNVKRKVYRLRVGGR